MKISLNIQAWTQVAVTALSFPALSWSGEPAYDCGEATGQVEQLICTDANLAVMDRQLAEVYRTALVKLPEDELPLLKAEQRGWIKGRNECWKADQIYDCVKLEYQTRIVELQIKSGQLIAPTPVGYQCGDDEGAPFLAAYYANASPPAVVLTRGQDQVIAFSAPSGSGAKYTTTQVEFWEHQGEATLTWFGNELKCSVLK